MCKVVYEAKHTLTKDNFDSFCREIGQKSSDPTIRKYIAIGEKYYDFINYADKLPNAWTTIYNLTLINSNTFLALIAANENFAIWIADSKGYKDIVDLLLPRVVGVLNKNFPN